MNDEIKEILDSPKILILSYGNYISLNDYVKLKDCITNLQKENESNINRIHELEQEIDSEYIQKEDYKSRCDKALKELKEIRQSTFTKYNSNEWDNCLSYNDDIEPLENTLKGVSNNERKGE